MYNIKDLILRYKGKIVQALKIDVNSKFFIKLTLLINIFGWHYWLKLLVDLIGWTNWLTLLVVLIGWTYFIYKKIHETLFSRKRIEFRQNKRKREKIPVSLELGSPGRKTGHLTITPSGHYFSNLPAIKVMAIQYK